ncbi:hypothetical protein WJX74_001860 [Apatococcus lobatus]|uniref:Uncharacterized protein n=1 Tax=Apatococcus lobatus TaxID=904363 RepID=A0AAW1R045_9CHLO
MGVQRGKARVRRAPPRKRTEKKGRRPARQLHDEAAAKSTAVRCGPVCDLRAELNEIRRKSRTGESSAATMNKVLDVVYNQGAGIGVTQREQNYIRHMFEQLPTHGKSADGSVNHEAFVLAKLGSAEASKKVLKVMTALPQFTPRRAIDLMRQAMAKNPKQSMEFRDPTGAVVPWSRFARGLGEDPTDVSLMHHKDKLIVGRRR